MAFLLNRLKRLAKAEDGATLVEFAFVAPVVCVMLVGSMEVGHTLYVQGILEGAVQKAARAGTLETAAGTSSTPRDAIDTTVRNQVRRLNKNATVTFSRRFYRTFTDAAAARAEEFTDSDTGIYANGICDHGEPFEDLNNNGVLDLDGGDAIGKAGARDNVVYTVTVTYPSLFPLYKFIGGSNTVRLKATTILANQPFGDQQHYDEPTVGHCT